MRVSPGRDRRSTLRFQAEAHDLRRLQRRIEERWNLWAGVRAGNAVAAVVDMGAMSATCDLDTIATGDSGGGGVGRSPVAPSLGSVGEDFAKDGDRMMPPAPESTAVLPDLSPQDQLETPQDQEAPEK